MLEDKHESQGLAALTETKEERIKLAKSSVAFNLKHYKEIFCQFSRFVNSDGSLISEEKIKENYEKLHPHKKEEIKKTQETTPKKNFTPEKKLDKKEAIHLEFEIESELENAVHFPVDVRILNRSPLSFRYNVFKEGTLLFSKDELTRSDFISLTMVMYHDFNFYRKRYMKEALGLEV